MGYLSCNAESAIAVSTPSTPPLSTAAAASSLLHNKQQKPIKIQQFHYSDLEAATNGFSDQKLLGRGSHGCVYKAVLRGRRVVAVKKPSKRFESGPQHQNQQQEVDNELEILSKIHSPGNSNARLGDFGLAIRCGADDDCRLRSTPPAGTMGYLDPCYVTPDNLSTKTDVFSFGILLLEIISGRKAIDVDHSPASIVDWAIPLLKRGKLGLIYDLRIPLLKDPLIKRQLVLIASKCVRSCRERRPSMKEVVDWLNALSKLVPLHSWNGFNNPCMMVETMGRPVELRNGEFELRTVKDSRRVFSDLGSRSSLIDLMAGGESDSMRQPSSRFSRSIFGSARYVAGGGRRTQSKTVSSSSSDNKVVSCLRRNKSVGNALEFVSETKEKAPPAARSRFSGERLVSSS